MVVGSCLKTIENYEVSSVVLILKHPDTKYKSPSSPRTLLLIKDGIKLSLRKKILDPWQEISPDPSYLTCGHSLTVEKSKPEKL